ncbi:GNAT family N-acetyltransferase [Agrococcus baldri]|uniref:N-acetyltransferase domain-containing protein n=1 Tax=Agrococcus baldri TaxID=153730 RepID=A0AA87RA24_9MICO|nr:GNAT family N-acetyltransferase [Agrococcus baldri]GEK78877.1 hypothetical protein ABA31_02280 [Agrococcus baldri]
MATPARPLPEGLVLRPPEPADAGAWSRFVVGEQARTYGERLPAGFVERELAAVDPDALAAGFARPGVASRRVAVLDGEIVGVASIEPAPGAGERARGFVPAPAPRRLDRLYVAPAVQGTGTAAALLDAVDHGGPLYLWLVDGNERAARFYERRGFRHLPERVAVGPGWGGLRTHRMLRAGSVAG